MKTKIAGIVMICFCSMYVHGQDSTANRIAKKHKNQIGVDMTVLIRQFFHLDNSAYPTKYIPEYFATYRRHLKNGNIRFAFSLLLYGKDDHQTDTTTLKPRKQEYNYRIGYEWISDINKRWQLFYGVDFKNDIVNDYNEFDYQNDGWRRGHDNSTITYALSPMLGIRFKFNDRISILTETSLDFLVQDYKHKPIITQISDNPGLPKPSEYVYNYKMTTTQINYPLFIELSFDL